MALSIGEVAERTGLSVHTLRFYEREGVLANPVTRDAGGRRVYTEDDVDWLIVCTVLRASDMPVPEVRRYTTLVREGGGNERERLALLREYRDRVTTRMAALTRSLDLVDHKIGVYEDILDGRAEDDLTEDDLTEDDLTEDDLTEDDRTEDDQAC